MLTPQAFKHANAYVYHKDWRQWYICRRDYYSKALAQALTDPDCLFQQAGLTFLKQGDTTTVASITIDGRRLVIKRYNLLNFRHRLRRLLRPTRAWLCWRYAHSLLQQKIPTPQPVAMLEQRFGPLHGTAYYICEHIEGVSALDYFTQPDFDPAMLEPLSQVLNKLGTARLAHGDLKATNILIAQDKPYLIDLDAMRYYPNQRLWQRARQRDLRRFLANWHNHPEIYAAFERLLLLYSIVH